MIFRVVVAGGTIAVLHEKEVVLRDDVLSTKRALPLATATRPFDIALSPDGERIVSCFESGVSLEGRSFGGDDRWGPKSALAWTREGIWALREPSGEIFVLDPQTLSLRARGRIEWGDGARISLVPHAEGHVYAVGAEGQHGAETHALLVAGDAILDVRLPELTDAFWVACTPSGARIASQATDQSVTVRDAASLVTESCTIAEPSFVLVGFVDDRRAVFANDSELRLAELAEPAVQPSSVAAALRARAPIDTTTRASGEERGTLLLERLIEAGGIELVRKANRRELAEHLDDLFASRRMTAETVASVLEEHDSVAELFADDETIARLLAEIG